MPYGIEVRKRGQNVSAFSSNSSDSVFAGCIVVVVTGFGVTHGDEAGDGGTSVDDFVVVTEVEVVVRNGENVVACIAS